MRATHISALPTKPAAMRALHTTRPAATSCGMTPARPPEPTTASDASDQLSALGGIAAWRTRLALTLDQAAAYLGLNRSTVWRMEQGELPTSSTVAALAMTIERGAAPLRPPVPAPRGRPRKPAATPAASRRT